MEAERCVATLIVDLILKHGGMKNNSATSLLSPGVYATSYGLA